MHARLRRLSNRRRQPCQCTWHGMTVSTISRALDIDLHRTISITTHALRSMQLQSPLAHAQRLVLVCCHSIRRPSDSNRPRPCRTKRICMHTRRKFENSKNTRNFTVRVVAAPGQARVLVQRATMPWPLRPCVCAPTLAVSAPRRGRCTRAPTTAPCPRVHAPPPPRARPHAPATPRRTSTPPAPRRCAST